ncbi:MAG: NAD-binding protein, partial [Peptostreptococcus sp.]|nr:NAD-binding protein [Peptostreptococcus sp.]
IAGSHEDLEKFLKKVGGLKRKVKTVMIIGGGKIAYYLCMSLENINIKTKIIERDRKTCHFLAQNLPKVDIIHGDGTDNQILEEEGIHEVDAFVSLTGIDEENIIMSMYADSKGASKVITKISQSTFKDMIDTFNLDTVISPKELTATRILQYVKAMNNSYGSQLNSLYRIVNDKVEVLEFSVNATGRIVNQPLKDLRFKKGMLIACIVRNGKIIIPGGDDKIMVGDNIIIVTSSLRITDIEDILERSV